MRDRDSVDAYVRRIMVNENNSLWRRAWKRREQPTDEVPEGAPSTTPTTTGRSAALWALVQTLPRKARAVVVLRYYEELTEAETADVLGISVGTVKSQTSRALAALRERTPADAEPPGGGAMTNQDHAHRGARPRSSARRADDLHGAPLTFDDVRGRARRHPAPPPGGGGGRGRRRRGGRRVVVPDALLGGGRDRVRARRSPAPPAPARTRTPPCCTTAR